MELKEVEIENPSAQLLQTPSVCPTCNGGRTVVFGVFEVECDTCAETGVINDPTKCAVCRGEGSKIARFGSLKIKVDCEECAGTGDAITDQTCMECRGGGTVIIDFGGIGVEGTCETCNGSGKKPEPIQAN